METVYDWVTVAIFAGLIVLFMQRSTSDAEPEDHLWQYLLASIGCAVANQFGNKAVEYEGPGIDWLNHGLALAILAATLGYVWYALKPFKRRR